jgi:3'(2'), 5'-bisphosphate nucleotidase
VTALDAASCAALLPALTATAVRAALLVRGLAGTGDVHRKRDGSPVTAADLAAEASIRDDFARIAPALPFVSEEQAEDEAPRIGSGASYALIDPLDGTREFIAGHDEYAINIAIMTQGRPILGIVAAPALGLLWRGIVGRAAERMTFAADGKLSPPQPIHSRKPPQDLVVIVSRSHLDARTQAYLANLPGARTMACGSAIKFGRVAEGSADRYPRLGPVRDWDAAAGHALLEAAGGRVTTPEGHPLRYGTAGRLIASFVASGDRPGSPAGSSA